MLIKLIRKPNKTIEENPLNFARQRITDIFLEVYLQNYKFVAL